MKNKVTRVIKNRCLETISPATTADWEDLKQIWKICFGDSDTYIQFCLERYLSQFFLCRVDGEGAAMLCVIPCEYQERKGGYVYAVATVPQFRRLGCSKRLLMFAEEYMKAKGMEFLCLVPATPSLFHFYAKQGYAPTFYLSQYGQQNLEYGTQTEEFHLEEVSCEEFIQMKTKLQQENHVVWSKEHLTFLFAENQFNGGKIYKIKGKTQTGLAVIVCSEKYVYVKELLGCKDPKAFASFISEKFKRQCVLRCEPKEGTAVVFGMAKPLKKYAKFSKGYISLVLD